MNINLSGHMCSQYSKLLSSRKYCDVFFIIGHQRIPAHRTVLAAQSEYFEKLLFGTMKEAKNEEVVLKDVLPATFQLLLKYAYTGCVAVKTAHLQVCVCVCV